MASPFLNQAAQGQIVLAVKDVESKSSAEIVVSVRSRSDDYKDIELLVGALLAILTIFALMYHPAELDEDLMPVETLAAFVLGAALVRVIGPLKRVLTPRRRRSERAMTIARSQFVELGVSRTRDRSGILVYVSELERAVCVVPDVGIEPSKMGEAWASGLRGLEQAASSLDVDAFTSALKALGPTLGAAYPRREDDTNELPDAPVMQTGTGS